MNAKQPELIPADPLRCQTEIESYHPFTIGGKVRCTNKPVVIATEVCPGKDGRTGTMSLCADCLTQFMKQMPQGFATFKEIGQ